MDTIRIGTRGSDLALWQARHVAELLKGRYPGLNVELREIVTEGDRRADERLVELGGKNLFVKELEQALRDGSIDIAVHSAKDVAVNLDPEFDMPVFLERGDARDALVSNRCRSVDDLPEGAVVGTCSLRRQSQILEQRADLRIKPLRGNVPTRLSRLDEGRFDAIILAVAGLHRLGLAHRIAQKLPPDLYVPSPGQGALGIECRGEDHAVLKLIAPLNDAETSTAVRAERVINRELGGSCHAPIGAHADIDGSGVSLSGWVGTADGEDQVRVHIHGQSHETLDLARFLAEDLVEHGALSILESYMPV